MVDDECPRLLINRERVGEKKDGTASLIAAFLGLGGSGGFTFPPEEYFQSTAVAEPQLPTAPAAVTAAAAEASTSRSSKSNGEVLEADKGEDMSSSSNKGAPNGAPNETDPCGSVPVPAVAVAATVTVAEPGSSSSNATAPAAPEGVSVTAADNNPASTTAGGGAAAAAAAGGAVAVAGGGDAAGGSGGAVATATGGAVAVAGGGSVVEGEVRVMARGVGNAGKCYRDALFLGDCDEGVQQLVKLLGWEEEFQRLLREVRGNFEAQQQQLEVADGEGS
jgi:hypothetical protein